MNYAVSLLSLIALSASAQTDGWYTFQPENDHKAPSAIGLEAWNAEPAGAHGRVKQVDDKLIYNGREIKLWGLNNTYIACAPSKEMAEKRAALYRKFGMNAIRLHKFNDGTGWAGIQQPGSMLEFDPEKLDLMDYYIATLKKNGIYTKFSPTFGVKFGPDDMDRIPYWSEIGDPRKTGERARVRVGYGLVYLAEEIQDLQIEQTVRVLNHKNPYTGKRYADEPAIFCVELFNEDSVLFSSTINSLRRTPTIRARAAGRFSRWLLEKYKTEEAWQAAWGGNMIISDPGNIAFEHLRNMIEPKDVKGDFPAESLAKGTVAPWCQSWFQDAAMRDGEEQAPMRQRMLDTMEFLILLQDEFYGRFVKAIRATGYEGEIIASNWQAGNHVGHFLNIRSDSKVGMIDRHNYYGGGKKWKKKERFNNSSMLADPGVGTLSAGMQQVDNRAFMLSEWIHEQPNEYAGEGPAILGAYGWGLNGWDVSYIFENNDNGEFSDRIGISIWDVVNPAVLASYAAISRQVRRMDVAESPETKALNIHIPSLLQNKTGFEGQTFQQWDTKGFTTDKVPAVALAATRVAIRFNDEYLDTPAFDLTPYLDGDTIVSSTKQLRWTPAPEGKKRGGYFTMNTAGTKAFVGFAPGGTTFDLGDGYAVTPEKGFCMIYLSAKGETETLATAKEIVMTVMARARNTGMVFNEKEDIVTSAGEAPLKMEPVRAQLALPFDGTLERLDQDGTEVASSDRFSGSLTIDGAKDKTPFYLIVKK